MMLAGAGKAHRRRKAQPEQVFQASLVKALAMVLDPSCVMFAVPNGGWRTKAEAAILMGQGVLPGVPDLLVIWKDPQSGKATAAGMELKAGKNGTTDAQDDMHARFNRAGVHVAVIRTLDEALRFLTAAGVPFRIKPPERG